MNQEIKHSTSWAPSTRVVARTIQGKLIVVPIEDGIADLDDVMYSFNETGTRIWQCIEDKLDYQNICATLAREYNADQKTIEQAVARLVATLVEKGIIEECTSCN